MSKTPPDAPESTDEPTRWNPQIHGISPSCLNLWLQDRSACALSYLENLEVQEPWTYYLKFGNLVGTGMEGYFKKHTLKAIKEFSAAERDEQVAEFGSSPELLWWAELATTLTTAFVKYYRSDTNMPLTIIEKAEENLRVEITLPYSGRKIILNSYSDGSWPTGLFENKCRGKWDARAIAEEIKWDLQYQWEVISTYHITGEMPQDFWYQTCLRPLSFGYRGPKKKVKETPREHLDRIKEHIENKPDTYFYRFIGKPTKAESAAFAHGSLYPMLEAFLDWYEYMTADDHLDRPNLYNWVAPYGQYNPFTEGTQERYRNYRLTGSTTGLRRKVIK